MNKSIGKVCPYKFQGTIATVRISPSVSTYFFVILLFVILKISFIALRVTHLSLIDKGGVITSGITACIYKITQNIKG